ncbi:hypothetical protein N7519_002735 [Penicillium mononematosum]|uniref:uncharacterized protein n=1 Tax=Penicillium mononematosum TaxID=268346 RepID=UPI002546D749|nr:uncharacterized protein N7519_002735 [Penicillium mononematosum]KAJ6187827.1 hypothetical protein N7519_002735 [Penicillium mononematosum]
MTETSEHSADYTYVMPHTTSEIQRLRNQHDWIKASMGGKLVFAPVEQEQPMHVLDSATADGFWCLDAAKELPAGSNFVAFDIGDHLFPAPDQIPAEIKLVKASVNEPFPGDWTGAFDFVHQRFLFPSLPEHEPALGYLLDAVKPGGWVQFVEVDMLTSAKSEASQEHERQQAPAFTVLRQLANSLLIHPTAAGQIAGWVRQYDFDDVKESTYDIAAGVGNPDPVAGRLGRTNMLHVLETFMGYYRSAKGDTMGLSEAEWDALPRELAREMDHFPLTVRINVVIGRRSL